MAQIKPYIVTLGSLKYEDGYWSIDGMKAPIYQDAFITPELAQTAFNELNPRRTFEKEAGVRGGTHHMKNEGYFASITVEVGDTVEGYAWKQWTQEDAWSWYVHGEGMYEIVLPHMQDQPEPVYVETAQEYAALVQQAAEMGAYGVRYVGASNE